MCKRNPNLLITLLCSYLIFAAVTVFAEEAPAQPATGAMNNEKLQTIITRIDPEYTGQPGHWQMQVFELGVTVITDENADRMRIVIPIKQVGDLTAEELVRLMQANFDTALDARYAIAQGIVWATFIHPLSPLSDEQFVSGLGQTINIVLTYGKTFSSGALQFGGGDSRDLIEKDVIKELMKRGQII